MPTSRDSSVTSMTSNAAGAAAAVYLALSGGNVATQRAFVMVACLFGAILIDRRALSLRALALAAMVETLDMHHV